MLLSHVLNASFRSCIGSQHNLIDLEYSRDTTRPRVLYQEGGYLISYRIAFPTYGLLIASSTPAMLIHCFNDEGSGDVGRTGFELTTCVL